MLANSAFVGAFSTSRPPYITAISSVCPATTPRSWVTRITDMLRSRRCTSMRSRICACTVTSSAVVGSSANSSVGPHAKRDGDHHPLAHAAGQLVRVLPEASRRLGDLDVAEQPLGGLHRLVALHPEVRLQRLGDLLADLHQRVQRRHRVLEDHRHLLAPDVAHLLGGEADQLLALEAHRSRALDRLAAEQSHDRTCEHRLAGPRLADDAERLAAVHRERHAVHRPHLASRRAERRVQVLDLEQRAGFRPAARLGRPLTAPPPGCRTGGRPGRRSG